MRYSLSLVLSGKKVHCAMIPRGQTSSYPLTFDREIRPHHQQFVLVTVGEHPYIYGLTGPKPSEELMEMILVKWAQRRNDTVKYLSTLTIPDDYTVTRTEIDMWVTGHINIEELRDSDRSRMLRSFPEGRKTNANA